MCPGCAFERCYVRANPFEASSISACVSTCESVEVAIILKRLGDVHRHRVYCTPEVYRCAHRITPPLRSPAPITSTVIASLELNLSSPQPLLTGSTILNSDRLIVLGNTSVSHLPSPVSQLPSSTSHLPSLISYLSSLISYLISHLVGDGR